MEPTEEQIQELVKKNRMPIVLVLVIIATLLFLRYFMNMNFYAVFI